MKIAKCSLDIEQHVEFKMSVLISPSKSLISSRWVTFSGKIWHKNGSTFQVSAARPIQIILE